MSAGFVVVLAILAFVAITAWKGVRIVPQSEKHVVERFGRLRAVLGPGIENAVLAIALTAWPPYARVARAETLTVRNSCLLYTSDAADE